MEEDHLGIEIIKVERDYYSQLQRRCMPTGLTIFSINVPDDSGPEDLVSVYHQKLGDNADRPDEVRLKVFLPREDPRVPSLYWIWKTADWQERESSDMFGIVYEGHPNLKRIFLMQRLGRLALRKDIS